MRPGSPPTCVTPTYFQSHQGAQGTDTTDREEKRNTSKMLFLKVKMTLKFFLIMEAICLFIKHK